MKCPKCDRVQHFVCGSDTCVCRLTVPEGELPQIWQEDGECLACPYCGYVAHVDEWAELTDKAMLAEMNR